jgi:hypothetical protein
VAKFYRVDQKFFLYFLAFFGIEMPRI